MKKLDWEINITNLAESVAEKYGVEVAQSPFTRFGASCFYDLDSAYYSEVYADLMQMYAD